MISARIAFCYLRRDEVERGGTVAKKKTRLLRVNPSPGSYCNFPSSALRRIFFRRAANLFLFQTLPRYGPALGWCHADFRDFLLGTLLRDFRLLSN